MYKDFKIGGHMSVAGGIHMAVGRVKEIGGDCLQIFSTSPMSWNRATITKDIIKSFQNQKDNLNVAPIYFHASYLINLADKGVIAKKSISSLVTELVLAKSLGVKGSVIHIGSFKGKEPNKEDFQILIKN